MRAVSAAESVRGVGVKVVGSCEGVVADVGGAFGVGVDVEAAVDGGRFGVGAGAKGVWSSMMEAWWCGRVVRR